MTGKTHKGFTLIELLVTVSIIATLSATMTFSVQGASAKAKVAAIASNIEACRTAAAMCLADNKAAVLATMTTTDVLKKYMPNWADFAYASRDAIVYTPNNNSLTGPDNWAVTVDFAADPDCERIKSGLQGIKGYSKYYDDSGNLTDIMGDDAYSFKVELYSGHIRPSDTNEGDDSSGG